MNEMTLDEAITHCEDIARSCDSQCGRDHMQLAEWLKELKTLRRERKEIMSLNTLAAEIHKNAVEHGWWDEERSMPEITSLQNALPVRDLTPSALSVPAMALQDAPSRNIRKTRRTTAASSS